MITAVVIGGTLLRGGTGRIWGTVAGALIREVIASLMVLSNMVSEYLVAAVQGSNHHPGDAGASLHQVIAREEARIFKREEYLSKFTRRALGLVTAASLVALTASGAMA